MRFKTIPWRWTHLWLRSCCWSSLQCCRQLLRRRELRQACSGWRRGTWRESSKYNHSNVIVGSCAHCPSPVQFLDSLNISHRLGCLSNSSQRLRRIRTHNSNTFEKSYLHLTNPFLIPTLPSPPVWTSESNTHIGKPDLVDPAKDLELFRKIFTCRASIYDLWEECC